MTEEQKQKKQEKIEKMKEEKEPDTLFGKVKYYLKRYWYIAVPAHMVCCTAWFGGLYALVYCGVDVVALLRTLHMPAVVIEKIENVPPSAGVIVVALILYKVATPLRYMTTLALIQATFWTLRRMGKLRTAREVEYKVHANNADSKKHVKSTREWETISKYHGVFKFIGVVGLNSTLFLFVRLEFAYKLAVGSLAKQHGVWISLGGFHNKDSSEPSSMPWNSHVIIDDQGETRALYNKLHLFDLEIPGKVRLMESEFSKSGSKMVPPVDTPIGRLGLSICYDLRFPELALWNRYKGAEILSYPSSFTLNTGLAHWEPLLRTRAIETQCYVIAAAQTGKHNDKRSSYGHSMVVDPWGAVVAQCSERFHNVTSSTICVQDGKEAGQTVKHVHVHVLARREGDFGCSPDNLYQNLATHDKDPNVQPRSQEEMSAEAALYRAAMKQI
ncbi:hydrolase, carbon-nitrogen family [Teladorsagia circumcincta]|uniref:Hydrolase, carbon-nitrogen family n=1 Tax=Teladorsagia circumcincta TaxID=45464 RepID=A0A2G9UA33_TELCI|nr:hydrolase, carbon-nitrogen family [Teladorsagia circumcincta]